MKKLIVSLAIGVTAIAQAGLFDIKINTRGNESNKRSKRSSWQLVDRQAFEEKAEAERKVAEDERKAAEEKAAAERKLAEEKAEAERKAAEDERKAAEEKVAAERKLAEEKAEAERRAAEEKAAFEELNQFLNGEFKERCVKLAGMKSGLDDKTGLTPCRNALKKVAEYVYIVGNIKNWYTDENAKYGFVQADGTLSSWGLSPDEAVKDWEVSKWIKLARERISKAESQYAEIAERRAVAEKAASQSAEEERLALSRYEDGTEMPACVLEVAQYMRDTFSATIEEASKSRARYQDFSEKTRLDPWSSWKVGMRELSLEDVFKYDVLGEANVKTTWENPPIKKGYGEKRFIVGGKWSQGSWYGGTWFSVRQNGELESDCAKMLSKMKDVVRRLNVAQKTFEAKSEEYAKRSDELHEGFKLNPFKSIHFGDTPYGVYTNLKALVKDNYEGDRYSFDQQRFLSRIIPQLPWRGMCGLALQNNTLEMGFSRYADDDAPGLTYLKLSFANSIPSVEALKKKYEGQGFVLKSENECIGSIWLDQEKVDSQVLRKYENAMTTLTGAALGGVSATEVDRAKKTLVEIQAKHMKPVYRETVSGTYKGYNLEIKTKGLKIRDGVVEGEGNPGDVESLVLWDQATIEAQQTEFVNFQKAAAESAARAAAEEAEKKKAAALDF